MSGELVHARVSAVKEISHGVASYGRSLTAVITSAHTDLNRAAAGFQVAVAHSQRQLDAAEQRTEAARAALERCIENCAPLEQELAAATVARNLAQDRHAKNLAAHAEFNRVASEILSSMRRVQTSAEAIVPVGRQHIQEYAEILTDYLKRGGSG